MLALSSDGTRLAVTYRGADGKVRLVTRLLQHSSITPLSNTEDASSPFFSADGQWIGFFANGQLKKISVEGGAAVTICETPNLRGASWGDDGNIVLAAGPTVSLSRVSSDAGKLEPVTKLSGNERSHRWPQVLPGSQHVLFTVASVAGNYDDANVEVVSLKTGERKILQRGGFSGRYLNSGHLIYLHQSTLFAAPFDLKRLAMTGAPTPILEDATSNTTAGGDFAFSDSGLFVYLSGRGASAAGWPFAWLDSAGKRQMLQAQIGRYFTPRISPDGKRVAFTIGAPTQEDIWVKDLGRDTPSRLTFLGGSNRFPVWTPDGRNIVFDSRDPKNPGIYWIRSDGSGEAERLTDGKSIDLPFSFSPDAKRLAFGRVAANGLLDVWTVPVEGDAAHPRLGQAELFVGTPFDDADPAFSPDGHWLAYASNESGTFEVYVRPFPGPGGKWQISTGGGRFPVWSRAGHELLFEKPGGGGILAVSYTTSQSPQGYTFAASTPRMWSALLLLGSGNYPNYDLAPDGKRIGVLLPPEDADSQKPATHLTFLLNFFDELRRKAPGKN